MGARTAQKLASTLVERMSQEQDTGTLIHLANTLSSFRSPAVPQKELQQIASVFQLPNAPCSVLLAFDYPSKQTELPKQLRNPLCREDDWKHLAVRAAQISGRPIAHEQKGRYESEIVVDFPKLSNYVWMAQPWYNRYKLSVPVIASLVLLVGALVALLLGLLRSRDIRSATEL
jgi:hypothetical protein